MTTLWQPDTCLCELEYDKVTDEGDPVWKQSKCCSKHKTADECLADNRGVNLLINTFNEGKSEDQQAYKSFNVLTNTFWFEFGKGVKIEDSQSLISKLLKNVPRIAKVN